MSEELMRKQILDLVKEYCDKYHKKEYRDGDKINYSGRVYDHNEMTNLVDSALDFWLTTGRYADRFEKTFAEKFGVKHCFLVNSGSSANLLAFMTLTSPLLGERAIRRGDEVITVAAGFPTTIAPIVQYGAVPVFVDVTIPYYNIDCTQLENALSDKTKAVMIAHTLGNPFDLKKVKEFCDKHGLWLVEDNCDALGSKYMLDGKEYYTGTVGDIGTSSFYPPHHMTMGEGGAVYTNDPLLAKIIHSMRDWGRECVCPSGIDNFCGQRYKGKFGNLPEGYDHKYVYSHFGYNLKVTDMQAAIGVAQLEKLDRFVEVRKNNFKYLYNNLEELSGEIILPKASDYSDPSWFGFAITLNDKTERKKVLEYLEKNRIQTRLLFSGNILKHPCFDEIRKTNSGFRVIGELSNTDIIMNNTFWVGVYPGMNKQSLDYIIDTIKKAVKL